jgi:ankyrin repeat protein
MANALDNDETGKALELLREGASPNARITLHKDAPSSLWEQIRDTFHPPDAYATVLMIACSRGMKDFARQLLDQGADVNARTRYGDTALHSACTQTDITVVRWLLDKHSDVNARDKEGMTPLFIAVGCRHTAEARLLLEHGADPLARDNDGQSAAYYAWRSSLKPEPEMVKLLKQYSVPP